MNGYRYRRIPDLTQRDIARFWDKVEKLDDSECWPWTAFTLDGYGIFGIGGKNYRAPRVAYILATGEDPTGFHVCHRCDNPPCCNAAHLFLASDAENKADMVRKGRAPTGERNGAVKHPESLQRGDAHYSRRRPELLVRGEDSDAAKLTDDQVREIRAKYRPRVCGLRRLGREYGINGSTVWSILHRKTWKHVN